MSETSPYRRDNYFGKDPRDTRSTPESPSTCAGDDGASTYGSGDGPSTNPGPGGTWKPEVNDPAASIAHQTLKECGNLHCRATLEDPPYNGGRTAELFAWLDAGHPADPDALIDGRAWALHHENKTVELSEPCCYPPAETAGEHRHRRRVNEETGYLNWGETTGVVIPDRPFEDFMAAVRVWLARRDGSLPPRRRKRALAYARRLKRQGEKSDQNILRLVIQRTRDHDLPARS